MINPDENQHWVPKFLIKNFADVGGRVFCLNIQTNEITKQPPKYAASSVGFNNFQIGDEIISFEDELEKIETAAAPVLKEIVSSGSITRLNATQRTYVADFMAAQSFRTETFSKGFDHQLPRQQFGPVFAQLWRSAFLLSAEILRRKWAVMVIDHDDVFYLGDHPVVLQHTETPVGNKEVGFDIEGVEAFLPLAPKCALYMPCATTTRLITDSYEEAAENLRLVKLGKANAADNVELLKASERVFKNAAPLYQALTTGVSIIADPGNVENLNYLQCQWAHSAVYSNRGDFTFAKRVFRENPQYKGTPRVRLETIDV